MWRARSEQRNTTTFATSCGSPSSRSKPPPLPFRGGFAGGCLFLFFAMMVTALGVLAIYAVI